MKVLWKGKQIAEAKKEDLIYIEGNWYFPPESLDGDYLKKSDTPYVCPWKGKCQYFDVGQDGDYSADHAFSYPKPIPTALDRVKKDFSNYLVFSGQDIEIQE